MILPIKNNPTGGMSKDIDRLYVGQGDYLDALNVTHITDTGGTTQAVQPALGNEYAFKIDQAYVQNKQYNIKIDDITTASYANTRLNITLTGNVAGTYTHTITTTYGMWASLALEIDTWLNGIISSGFTVFIDPYNEFIEIEILNNNDGNFFTSKISPTGISAFPVYVTQENIYPSLIGKMKIIGSYDLNGDLFIWSCVDRNFTLPAVSTALYLGTGVTQITTATPHGLSAGDNILVNIDYVGGNVTGIYYVYSVIDATNFTIYETLSGLFVSGSIAYLDENLSEIGVAQKNFNNTPPFDKWTYKKLIRSKQLNFRIDHQVDTYCEVNNCIPSLYWTDNYNKPKVMYYYGTQYIVNGFLTVFNPDAIYDYDTIGIESNLVLGSPNIRMTVTQSDEGGQLRAFARQYVVRFSNNKSDYTEWSYVSNKIPMAKQPSTTPWGLWAAYPGEQTSKKNIITIENVKYSLFNYVQLGVLEYSINNYYIAKTVELVGQDGDVLTLEHTGFETQILDLDITTIPQVFQSFDKVLNISALNNRLILSNLTINTEYDLRDWARTIHYDLNIKQLEAFGVYYPDSSLLTNPTREYQVADNQSLYTGYMRNETYRFGIQVHYKGGNWSSAYFVDDITFDQTIHNPLQQNSFLPTLDLTSLVSGTYYINVAYPSFTNINLDYQLPDGKILSQIIDGFRFVRLDCVPEVLFTGTAIMSKSYIGSSFLNLQNQNDFLSFGTYAPPIPPARLDRYFANINSPDIIFGLTKFNFVNGDIIKNIGAGTLFDIHNVPSPPTTIGEVYSFDGEFNNATGFIDVPLEDVKITIGSRTSQRYFSQFSTVFGNATLLNGVETPLAPQALFFNNLQVAVAVQATAPNYFVNSGTNNDTGMYYVQYFRARPNKYDEILTPQYKSTGQTEYNLSAHTTSKSYDVFGGDTFVQKTYFLNYIGVDVTPTPNVDQNYALGFYSENRGNYQYRYGTQSTYNPDNLATFIPGANATPLLFDSTTNIFSNGDGIGYTTSNNPTQSITSYIQYDPTQIANCLGTRMYYSALKVRQGNQDGYRVFLPLNYKDLNPTFGDIMNTEVGNGELLTWQEQYFQRQYFSNSGTLIANDGSELLVGNGSILAREPQYVSKFGTKFKWGVIKGNSKGGNDTFYWINDDFKKIVRFGYDGTVALSDIQGVKAFLEDNLTYAQYFLAPASGYGIHGVWHDYKGEAIWTVKSYLKPSLVWTGGTSYYNGDYVTVEGDTNVEGYEQFPQVYLAIQYSVDKNPTTEPEYWYKLPITDNRAYQTFTLAYNEIKNKFTTFYTYKPNIYLAWKNTFLSPCPIVNNPEFETSEMVYEHNLGEVSAWYCAKLDTGGGYVSGTYNSDTDSSALEYSGTSFLTTFANIGNGNFYSMLDDNGVEYPILEVVSDTEVVVQGNFAGASGEVAYYKFCNAELPYIEMITNYEPNDYKNFLASQFNCEANPQKIEYRGQNYVTDTDSYTYTERYELEKREGYWYTPIYNDVTGSLDGNTRTEDTSRMFGKYLRTKFIFKLFKNNKLFNFITKLTLNSRSYKK